MVLAYGVLVLEMSYYFGTTFETPMLETTPPLQGGELGALIPLLGGANSPKVLSCEQEGWQAKPDEVVSP
jgi:hypothetical protein